MAKKKVSKNFMYGVFHISDRFHHMVLDHNVIRKFFGNLRFFSLHI